MKNPEGLGQLRSPPASARAFASWLIASYRSDDRPLSTVQLLISEETTTPFCYELDGKLHEREAQKADMATVKKAIRAWYKLGNSNPDDLMLFYFCGHGLSEGALTSLLMSDFGSDPMGLMDGALDLGRLHSGMDDCLARHQCYFIDACRSPSSLLRRHESAGEAVLRTDVNTDAGGRARLGPKFMSTMPGDLSHGVPGKPSLFTGALLEALNGAGAGDEDGVEWVVKTSRLHSAMQYLVKEIIDQNGRDVSQQTITDGMQDLPLNTLLEPVVPVSLRVDPDHAHIEASFRCTGGNGINLNRAANPAPWSFRVPVGAYTFQADFASQAYQKVVENGIVRPPYTVKRLKVQ